MNIIILILVVMLLCYLKGRADGDVTVQKPIVFDCTKGAISYTPNVRQSGRTTRMLQEALGYILSGEKPEIWIIGAHERQVSDLRYQLFSMVTSFDYPMGPIEKINRDTWKVNNVIVKYLTIGRLQNDPAYFMGGRRYANTHWFIDHYVLEIK